MNFGQRYLELETSYSLDQASGQVTLYVSQMPPNANIFQPGPAMIFLVVDGVPSTGQVSGVASRRAVALARTSGLSCWLILRSCSPSDPARSRRKR